MRTLIFVLILGSFVTVSAQDLDERVGASREIVQEFSTKLKSALKTSLQEGGISSAIQICSLKAPKIATELSHNTGWEIKRTSLKIRNPENSPDGWEKNALLELEKRKEEGEDISNLEQYEVIESEEGEEFRYLKAIPTSDMCLMCHGKEIAPEISEKIKSLYPQDNATGFGLNDIRGAFSLIQPML